MQAPQADNGIRWVYLGLFLFGLIFNAVGWGSFWVNRNLDRKGVRVQAEIAGFATRVSDGSTLYGAIFRYSWADSVIIQTSNTFSNPPMYTRGEKVVLIVNPENPVDFMTDSFWSRYLFLIVFGGVGILVWVAALAVYFFR